MLNDKELKPLKLEEQDIQISIAYDTFEQLIVRKSQMTKTVLNRLNKKAEKEIKDIYVSISKSGDFVLNYILTPIKK